MVKHSSEANIEYFHLDKHLLKIYYLLMYPEAHIALVMKPFIMYWTYEMMVGLMTTWAYESAKILGTIISENM